MNDVLSIELTKVLNEMWLLKDVETECVYHNIEVDWTEDTYSVDWISEEITIDSFYDADCYKKEFERLKKYYNTDVEILIENQKKEFKKFNIDFNEEEHDIDYRKSHNYFVEKYSKPLIFYKALNLQEFKEFVKKNVPEEIIEWYFSDTLTSFYFNIKDAEELLKYLLENNILKSK